MCVCVCVRVYTQIITNLSHWHNILPDSPTVPRPSQEAAVTRTSRPQTCGDWAKGIWILISMKI